MELTRAQKRIFKKHSRAVVHIRKRLKDDKLSLVLGAGISKDFGIPLWEDLIEDIANDTQVKGFRFLEKYKNRSYTSKTQVLFHHYASRLLAKNKNLTEGQIKNAWRNIVRKYLYKKVKEKNEIKEKHPYIKIFLEIIKDSPITVNYNFDDCIEVILQEESKDRRTYETVWDPQLQTKLNKCVIYHPNGFLPQHTLERQSDGLVFCEDEYADQLIESMAGRYASLLHHYSQKTCLFIGISLDDVTLKHLLRQSAKLNPGHYHYFIAFQKEEKVFSNKEKEAIFDANFKLYNLITLFLTNPEIKILGDLLTISDDNFVSEASAAKINLFYCYYLVGAIGVGKSAVISYFRSLYTHDEWADFRIPELGKSWNQLSNNEKNKVDKWIAEQFCKKNDTLNKHTQGIHIVDRAPLDPLAFTPPKDWSEKAEFLIKNICTIGHELVKIKSGHVILLIGDSEILEERARSNGKEYDYKHLDKMQKVLKKIYKAKDLSIINTTNKNLEHVVKEIARIIHIQDYRPINLQRIINKIRDRK